MFFKTTAAPCALLLAALATPAFAQETPTELDSVIVTGQRNPDDPAVVAEARDRLSRTPGAVAVVASESYEDRYALGFADTLRSVPGVFAQRRWGEEVRLSIRGSGIGQSLHLRGVLLAQDGVPFSQPDGFGDFQELDPLVARYFEVYKGGNALRFGGAALGGAINVLTPTGRNAPFSNLLRLEGGSFETRRAHGAIAREFGPWDIYAAATWSGSEGFLDHQDSDSKRLTLNIGRQFGEDRELRLIVQANDLDLDISGTQTLDKALNRPRDPDPFVRNLDFGRNIKSVRVTAQTRWRLTDELVFEAGAYAVDKHLFHPVPVVLDNDYRFWGGFSRLDWAGRLGELRADAFAGAYFRTGDNDSAVFLNTGGGNPGFQIGSTLQNATGMDVFAEGRLFVTDQLALIAGGTWGRAERDVDNHLVPANSAQRDYDWFAPRVGLLWEQPDGSQIYANVTKSVEAPTFLELVQTPVPQFVDLDQQEAWTAEIGARGQRGAFRYDIALYRSHLEGELLNYVVIPNNPPLSFNAEDTVHQGIEAGLDWRLVDNGRERLTLRQTYTWSDFFFDDDATYGDGRLPIIPEHAYRAELKYEHPAGWFIAPSVEWVPQDIYVDYANQLKYPGYTLLSLNAGVDLPGGVSLFADLRNLTDEKYVSNANAITDARTAAADVFTPGEGRSAYVGLRYAF
ncbi:TonB-dependent receptor family protein [Brevundimonas fontaquae]|uniref:TonB-dependent receptor n=1 Tax=Brevundimonas fontaquae TaxID=2813778 RepID=A0ABX7LLR1_9CAUL|nr:TonB-dependent receptor [Brevundimonas fontaquae]QSF53764.1 TonB-dependent receptor [Brevundimonas fontaquae]